MTSVGRLALFKQKQTLVFAQLLFTCVTIFASPSLFAASDCLSVRPAYLYVACIQKKLSLIFNPQSPILLDIKMLSTNGQIEIFKPPSSSHAKGIMHSEIYRIKKNEKNFLVKTILPGSKAYIDENYFTGQLYGYLLGSELSGAEILSAGRFRHHTGIIGYYIEMEELFPNDKNSYTFKGLKKIVNSVKQKLGFRILTKKHLQSLARLIVKALEHGVYLDDVDFIFSKSSDEVRWIDTTHWDVHYKSIYSKEAWHIHPDIQNLVDPSRLNGYLGKVSLHDISEHFMYMKPMHHAYTQELWDFLRQEIQKSKIWDKDQKQQVTDNFISVLSRFEWFQETNGYSCSTWLED